MTGASVWAIKSRQRTASWSSIHSRPATRSVSPSDHQEAPPLLIKQPGAKMRAANVDGQYIIQTTLQATAQILNYEL